METETTTGFLHQSTKDNAAWYDEIQYFLKAAKENMAKPQRSYTDMMNPLIAVQILVECKVKQMDEEWQANH